MVTDADGGNVRGSDLPERMRFETAIAARQFELQMFWQRSLFFWGFIAAAFIAFVDSHQNNSLLALVVACFGVVCSFAWTLANRGSKFWQESWERKLHESERILIGHWFVVAAKPFNNRWYTERFSVTKLVIWLSDFTFIVWIGCTVYESQKILQATAAFDNGRSLLVYASLSGCAVFSILMFIFARQHVRDTSHVIPGQAKL
jgi:hypothetical protein